MTDDVDSNRRHFLAVATAVTGGAGIALAAIPFIASLKPSARAEAQGAPVEVAVGSLEPHDILGSRWIIGGLNTFPGQRLANSEQPRV